MLYPITMLLWAIFCSGPTSASQFTTAQTPIAGIRHLTPGGQRPDADSLVWKDLNARLEAYQQLYPQEKLYLQLDRTLLKPGETLWFNAFLLNAGDLLPSLESQMLRVDLLDVRGSVIRSKNYLAFNGVVGGDFDFPASLPGGLYKIKAYSNWMRNFGACFERDITLQKVVLPRVNLKLEFERKGLSSGDMAIARFDAHSLDNQAIANKTIRFSASVAGAEINSGEVKTDAQGRAYVRFPLPEKLESSDGLLNVQVENGGLMEAISRPIPIVLNKVDLQFFPEGGNAVAGLESRMALKAVNEFGKPADVEGIIQDSKGRQVAAFSSFHDGMGAFDFTPLKGETYVAKLIKPAFIEKSYELPPALSEGCVLGILEQNAEEMTIRVKSSKSEKVYLTAQSRDNLCFFKALNPNQDGEALVKIPVKDIAVGIVRFTLFDQNKNALAERLAFVNREHGLKINIKADKDKYLPREKVRLDIQVADHQGKPVQGNFSLGVTDESLLSFADDKQGHLLASLLLEQDVKGAIEEPNFYFDTTEPKSKQALDYLLMTQGWRRFAWKHVIDNQQVNRYYTAEKARITGTVLRTDEKPAYKGKIQLYPNGPVTWTDRNGHFSFENVNIDKFTHLKYLNEQYYPLNSYGEYLIRQVNKTSLSHASLKRVLSQNGATFLCGKIGDDKEPLIGASVKALKGNDFVYGTITDLDGNFRISLDPGTYDVEVSYTGFKPLRINGVQVLRWNSNYLPNVILTSSTILTEVVITSFKVPLIEQDNTSGGQTLSSDQLKQLPGRSLDAIAAAPLGKIADKKAAREEVRDIPNDDIAVPAMEDMAVQDMEFRGAEDKMGLEEVTIVEYKAPMIRADDFSTGATFSKAQIVPRAQPMMTRELGRNKSAAPYSYRNTAVFSQSRVFYVPQYAASQATAERSDFRPTIYWNPNIQTNKLGAATVEFYTSDAITNFRATVEGLSDKGQPGRCEQKFFAQKPVVISLKTPASVVSGDVLNLQVAISNNTAFPAGGNLNIAVPAHFMPAGEASPKNPANVLVAAGETKVISLLYKIGLQTVEDQNISIKLSADEIVLDAFETTIRTINAGYPVKQVAAGYGAQSAFNIRLNHPAEGTLSATLTAYPSPLEDLLKGMERMLQQPSGCFEQVSSSNYPNLLVLDLIRQTRAARPEIETRAMSLLEDGYKKLTAYECKSGGYDWWGRDPGHEGLTAYGIMEFTDMAKVFAVDKSMIARTVKWLYGRRDEKGGWTLNPNSLHGWQNDPVLDCYIVWALAEAGYGQEFSAEINHATEQAVKSNDPYQMALLANALLAMGDSKGKKLLQQLLEKQEENGSWLGATHSVMYAYGDCFRIETTALAALAMMKSGKKTAELQKAMDFLVRSKTEYGYGSTQSTVMALKALINFVKLDSDAAKDGHFTVTVDGKKTGDYTFSTKAANKLEIKNLEQYFSNDTPRIEVYFEDAKTIIPFDIEIKYASKLPQNSVACPLSLTTALDKKTTHIGETVRLTGSVKNNTAEVQASPMVVVGIPSGLSLQAWQLKKLVDEKHCDFYELWDGFAVFHFEQLAPGEQRNLNLDLRADIAGTFEAPASQAFLYYSNDQRVWSKPESIEIR